MFILFFLSKYIFVIVENSVEFWLQFSDNTLNMVFNHCYLQISD